MRNSCLGRNMQSELSDPSDQMPTDEVYAAPIGFKQLAIDELFEA